jgi:hypothetical protein
VVAPIFPLAVCYGLIMLTGRATSFGDILAFAKLTGCATVWSLALGSSYLAVSPRRSGTITRSQCLYLGGVAGMLFPAAFLIFFSAVTAMLDPGAMSEYFLEGLMINLVVGVFFSPFGILGGWLLWRISVRPAKPTLDAVEQVFE